MGASLLHFIQTHWWHVTPLLIAGLLALAIILERSHALYWDFPFPYADAFMEKVRYLVLADRLQEATAFCDQILAKPMVRVVREGLIRGHLNENIIENGLQVAVHTAADKVQERTAYLATIANVATLLGLLGTIAGLIQSFDAIGNANAVERAALLATGISVAMYATLLGLAVAVPCLIAHAMLSAQADRLLTQIDAGAIVTLEILRTRLAQIDPSRESSGAPGSPQTGFTSKGGARSSITLQGRNEGKF